MSFKKTFLIGFCLSYCATGFAQYEEEGELQGELDPGTVIEDLNEAIDEDAEPEKHEPEPDSEIRVDLESQKDSQEKLQQPDLGGRRESTPRTKVFGDYKIHLGLAKPEFKASEEYEMVYGETRFYPTMSVEYFFFDWYANLGLIFRIGYYKDDGHAVIQEGDKFVSDKQGKTETTLIPLQVGISGQMTPFPAKWITLAGWFAGEATYFQEIRKNSGSNSSETTSSDSKSSSSNKKLLANTGWRYGSNVGIALSFLLNYLDQKSVNSMRPMGLSGVYLTPYVEATTAMFNDSDFTFDRVAYGLAFTFETL